ncbi:MAG: 16S rRNA (guanine(966)-N(2))-methyltransferase [uncultured Chloroflexi bacterium]|uniref:16S rRNA (Guanine(966)-N(2))-methyltransferase n=1 Tax=uncultured Chloroflexota bacterium TaxID=166587 RepID=A0A6J4I950_9CHLR|nr:MAG: 16S rRNA (guanine(966)-N(2))-methyltransferase [uncultured Chloroflexota bacterium]
MRVIAGEAGGMPLVAPPGRETRPTADKVKGAIFSSLGDAGCTGRVLDLFAGSGALGIEALSRGADYCDFVDSAATACKAIRANLEKTRLASGATVHCQTAQRFIAPIGAVRPDEPAGPYDLILLDPPYAIPDLESLLHSLAVSPLAGAATTLLVEHASRRALPPVLGRLRALKTRAHGDSAFTIYAGPATG